MVRAELVNVPARHRSLLTVVWLKVQWLLREDYHRMVRWCGEVFIDLPCSQYPNPRCAQGQVDNRSTLSATPGWLIVIIHNQRMSLDQTFGDAGVVATFYPWVPQRTPSVEVTRQDSPPLYQLFKVDGVDCIPSALHSCSVVDVDD